MKIKLYILVFFSVSLMQAQEICTYRGMVMDSLDIPVYDASISAFDADNQSAGYTFSDEEGEFKLDMPCNKSYELEIDHISYKPKLVKIELKKSIREKIVLKSSQIKLKDVVAQGRVPIKIKGDTIEYDADSFKTGNEEDLEDILKRLPGIQVEDGKVYYQGKQINSIKVEGREIFGGNTKLLTKNLPSDAVDKIQLNKKFKANPFANSMQGEEQPELNILLKEDKKNLIFGNATLGGDADKHYDIQEKLFRFSRKTDATLISDFNTYGKEVFTTEDYFQFLGGLSAFTEEGGSNALRSSMQNIMFSTGQKATTMHNHLGAFHLGYEPKDNLNITAFAFATDNNLNFKSTAERINPEFSQRDEKVNNQDILSIISRFKVDYTVNDKSSIKYRLNFNQQKEDNLSDIQTFVNNETIASTFYDSNNERINSNLAQSLSYIRKVGKDDNFGIYLNHTYQKESPDLLLNSSTEPFAGLFGFTSTDDTYILNQQQELASNTFEGLAIYNHLITNLSNIRFKLGLNISQQDLRNQIWGDNNMLENEFTPSNSDFSYDEYYVDATYTRKIDKLRIDVGTGLHTYKSENENSIASSELNLTRLLPHFKANYTISSSSNIILDYEQTFQIPQIREITEGYFIQNYFNIYQGSSNLTETRFHKVNLSYHLFNYFKFLNLWLNARYNRKSNNIRSEGIITPQVQFTQPFNANEPEESWTFNLNARKRFTKMYTLKFRGLANLSSYESRVNTFQLDNTMKTWDATLTNIFKFGKIFEIELGLNYSQSNYDNDLQENEFITWKPFATTAWMISPKLLFQADYNFQNQFTNGEKINDNHDLELKLRFKPAKKLYTYITVGNLLDNDKIVTNSFDGIYTNINTRNVLGRFILAQIKYKF